MRLIGQLRNRRGATLVVVAIALIVLIGMAALAVDVGQMYIARQRAQNVCDAAALAGGQFLTGTSDCTQQDDPTVTSATRCADGNNELMPDWQVLIPGRPEAGVDVSFPSGAVTDDAGNTIEVLPGEAIRVTGEVNVNFGFAQVLGFKSKRVAASATVVLNQMKSFCSPLFIPLAVSNITIFGDPMHDPIQFGDSVVLKVYDWDADFIGSGNFGPVVLPGDQPGANIYRSRLSGSANELCISLTETIHVETQTGNIVGPTYQGITDRLSQETDPRFISPDMDDSAWNNWQQTWDPDTLLFAPSMRIVIVPIVNDMALEANGKEVLEIKGLAGFFIESIVEVKEKGTGYAQITGRFIQGIAWGDDVRWLFPVNDGSTDPMEVIRTVRLVS